MAPPYTSAPTRLLPGPNYQVPGQTALGAPVRTSIGAPVDTGAAAGVFDRALEGLKSSAPELIINAASTKANHSELGQQVRAIARAPLSFFIAGLSAVVAVLAKGLGPVGEWSAKTALGAAHATVAELSRPEHAAVAKNSSGVEGVEQASPPAPTEP